MTTHFVGRRLSPNVINVFISTAVLIFPHASRASVYAIRDFYELPGIAVRGESEVVPEWPGAIAVGPDGSVYIFDTTAVISRVAPSGTITTVAGQWRLPGFRDGDVAVARFGTVTALAVDSQGTIYAAESTRIRKITPGGQVTTLAGSPDIEGNADGIGSMARFSGIAAMAIGGEGTIYVADSGNAAIRAVSSVGNVTTLVGGPQRLGYADGTSKSAKLSRFLALAVDAGGNIFTLDSEHAVIRRVAPDGSVKTFAGTPNVKGHVDAHGTEARFLDPSGLALKPDGTLLVADGDCTLRTVSPDASVKTIDGVNICGGNWKDAQGTDRALATAPDGTVYVLDRFHRIIRQLSPDGVLTPLMPEATLTSGSNPWEVHLTFATDATGAMFMADFQRHVIWKVTSTNRRRVLAGQLDRPGSSDGKGSDAHFFHPVSVAVGPQGSVVVLERGGLRRISRDGLVTTLVSAASTWNVFETAVDLVVADSGDIYFANDTAIFRWSSADGLMPYVGRSGVPGCDDGGSPRALAVGIRGLALDSDGSMVLTDSCGIRRIATDRSVTTVTCRREALLDTPPADGMPDVATCGRLADIASLGDGMFLFSDGTTIRKLTREGTITTLGAPGGNYWNYQRGLAVGRLGELLVDGFSQLIPMRYLSEGVESRDFHSLYTLFNPTEGSATARLTLMAVGRDPLFALVDVPAQQRVTLAAADVFDAEPATFSVAIDANQPLAIDRTVTWQSEAGAGAHSQSAIRGPASTWYVAEGTTAAGFNLFYLLQNPGSSESIVRATYLRDGAAPLQKTYTVPAMSRANIWANVETFDGGDSLADAAVSAIFEVQNDQPLVVEHALYGPGRDGGIGAGTVSEAASAPATRWYFAEGATGSFFDMFLLVQNPTDDDAEVTATYALPDGSTVEKAYHVAARSRTTIWVDHEDARLADTAVATTVRSTNGVPVVAERSMWWPDANWTEGHTSLGATLTGSWWAIADGAVDAARNQETYLLVQNVDDQAADVQVTLIYEDGSAALRTFIVAPHARFNIPMGAAFGIEGARTFSAIVETLGDDPPHVVVERSVYWDVDGRPWGAGTNALATLLR